MLPNVTGTNSFGVRELTLYTSKWGYRKYLSSIYIYTYRLGSGSILGFHKLGSGPISFSAFRFKMQRLNFEREDTEEEGEKEEEKENLK